MFSTYASYALTASATTTPVIPFGDKEYGTVFLPATGTTTKLTFYGAESADGTFVALYDSLNAEVARTVAVNRAYAIPSECYGCGAIKIVANVAAAVLISTKG